MKKIKKAQRGFNGKLDPRVAEILNGAAVYPITLPVPGADKKDPK